MATGKDKESFEDLFRRLEETVAKLEEGGLTLNQSLTLYEEGMTLAQRCQEMLDAAELKVRQLKETFSAYATPEPEEIEGVGDEEGLSSE
jgi:exodeoxyribonuclease VII small subunit